jgi:phage recombination protein Bet
VTTDIATIQPTAALAIRPGQEMWTDKQRAALSVLGIKDATNGDLAVFMHYCQKTGLDPFSRQIYMIMRRVKEGDQWVAKQTIQVGIDGFRVIRDRIAARLGVTVEYEDTIWYDTDGSAHRVWLWEHAPAACAVTVVRDGHRFPGVVRTASYMAVSKNGDPVSQWKTQPDHMIEKCAEAFALRRAFPNDLGGIYLEDEMAPAEPAGRQRQQRVTAAEITGNGRAPVSVPPAESATPPAPAAEPPPPAGGTQGRQQASSGQRSAIGRELDRLGIEDPEERLGALSRLAGREIDAPADLAPDEAKDAIARLKGCGDYQALIALTMAGDKPGSDG